MLAKTHGQPASPTRLGKELKVFTYRLSRQLELLKKVAISGKFGGATGNFNAHNIAFPEIDWAEFGNRFLTQKLKIERETYTIILQLCSITFEGSIILLSTSTGISGLTSR